MKYLVFWICLVAFPVHFASAQSVVAKREFNNTLKAYFETKNALSKDLVPELALAAEKLIKIVEEFPIKTLSAEQQKLWLTESKNVVSGAKIVAQEKELKAQRAKFDQISESLYVLVKAFNMNNQEIYWQYCPMVKKSWLNEVQAIQNPYYGSKMYACGNVKETITKP